jgi:alanine racemase
MSRPTEIVINLAALKENCKLAQSLSARGKVVAVVKADAYGHGAKDIANALAEEVALFAVSSLEEAIVLRDSGIAQPILLLEGCFSDDEYILAATQNFEIVVHNELQLNQVLNNTLTPALTVWLKVDSGMHRLGVSTDSAVHFYQKLKQSNSVKRIVLTTHLASADCLEFGYTEMQLARFSKGIQPIIDTGDKVQVSIANSAGLLAWPDSRCDWNRPGIMLYGLSPFAEPHPIADKLNAVMTFQSQVIAVRTISKGEAVGYGSTWVAKQDSIIATVAAGYGDGYPRTAKSGTPVLVNGQRAALAGRVSMDMLSIDVTSLDNINVGDKVELWGESLSANEVASWADSIGYELVTRMPKRTRREFIS